MIENLSYQEVEKRRTYLKTYQFMNFVLKRSLDMDNIEEQKVLIAVIALYTKYFASRIHDDLCLFFFNFDLLSPVLEKHMKELRELSLQEKKWIKDNISKNMFDEPTRNYMVYFGERLKETCPNDVEFLEWVRILGRVYAATGVAGGMSVEVILKCLKPERRIRNAILKAYRLLVNEK